MSGAHIRYAATRCEKWRVHTPPIVLHIPYAMSGTGMEYEYRAALAMRWPVLRRLYYYQVMVRPPFIGV
eukprot:3940481-Rhodomonas_salina.12